MSDQKVDLAGAVTDGTRESGTGIGMAVASEAKAAESNFLESAAAELEAQLGGDPDDDRRREPEEDFADDELDEQEEPREDEAPEGEEEEAGEEEEGESEDGGEEEQEDDARVSIRLNGKKANLEDVLDHVGATVMANGEEIEVTGSELIKGYQRGKDYSDKTTELKRERDDLMPYSQMVAFAKQDPQFLEHVQNYFQNGPFPELTANPDLKTNDAELARMLDQNDQNYDPKRAGEIVQLRAQWIEKTKGRDQINEAAQREYQTMQNNWLADQIRVAQDVINNIGAEQGNQYKEGETEYTAKSKQVVEFLQSAGYNENEISGQQPVSTSDARAAILAYKASEYDRMMRQAESPRVTLGKKRKTLAPPRSQKTGRGTRRVTGKRQQRDSFRKASKNQTTDGWISAIEKRLT